MQNVMIIGGYRALIAYEPQVEKFRGEFLNMPGENSDLYFFWGDSVKGLRAEGVMVLAQWAQQRTASDTKMM